MKGSKGKGKLSLLSKHRIYPTPETERKLMETMEAEAKVYNRLLDCITGRIKQGGSRDGQEAS